MPPAISIIVRSLGGSHLAEALASLAAQTRRDFEAVVVDMSEGANAPALERLAPQLTALRVITLPRSSRPKALNAGIAAASAPVIGILDDDNLYDPAHVDILLAGLASTNADWVYTGVRHATYTPAGEWIATRETGRPFVPDDLLSGNSIYATGSAFRKNLWERLAGYDERFDVLEDWEFLLRAAQAGAIGYLGVVSSESRKFTGIEGISAFDLETAAVRRCRAGIYWKHRRLFLSRRGSKLFPGLVRWFVHNLRDGAQSE